MTKDLDIVVVVDDAFEALNCLRHAGFRSATPIKESEPPEPMYILTRHGSEVDLLVAAGEPESTVVEEATSARIFGIAAAVATLEQLLYLYSNHPRHISDFVRSVTETNVDLNRVVLFLKAVHPEMLRTFRERVRNAKQPPPPPPRPKSS